MNRLTPTSIFVDNGFIELATTCPWKAYAKFILQRNTAAESSALRFGRHIHTALAYRNRMEFYGRPCNEEMQVKILENRFRNTPLEYEEWRNFDNAVKVIKGYNSDSLFSNGEHKIVAHPKTGLPLVEQPFAIDTGKIISGRRLVYIGRIDRTMRFPEGIFVRDYKTTSVLGDMTWSEAQMSEQLRGYCWALRETLGIEPIGYCYDAIACRESIQNSVWDDVLGRLRGENPKSKAVPLTFESQRFFTKEPPGQLDEWFANMCHQVETFLWHFDRNIFPRHHYHCRGKYGLCEYIKVCELPERSREAALNSNAFKTEAWSPLYKNK